MAERKVASAATADVSTQAIGTVTGRPFQWDGRLGARNLGVPDVYTGIGVPSTTNVFGQARVGSLYFRVDGGGAGATHIYYCTVTGAPGTWIGIA